VVFTQSSCFPPSPVKVNNMEMSVNRVGTNSGVNVGVVSETKNLPDLVCALQ